MAHPLFTYLTEIILNSNNNQILSSSRKYITTAHARNGIGCRSLKLLLLSYPVRPQNFSFRIYCAQFWSPPGKLGHSSPRGHRKTSTWVTSRRTRGDEVRPRGEQSCALIFETFLALLVRRSRVGQNEFQH